MCITFRGTTLCSIRTSLPVALIISAVPTLLAAQSAPAQAPAPAAAPGTAPSGATVAFSGEVRTRSEWDHPGGVTPADLFTYLRTRFGARVEAAPGVRVVLQVQDSRVLGAEGNPAAAAVETFGVHQAHVELRAPWRGLQLALRAGRQEIALGNERLVGAVGWSNTGRSFDGMRVTAARPGADGRDAWQATLFAATVEERGRRFGAASDTGAERDHVLAGIAGTTTVRGGTIELTALYDAGGHYRGFDHADRATLDARLRVPDAHGIALDVEGAWQAGRQRDAGVPGVARTQQLRAWMAGVRVGPKASRRLSLQTGVDILSGDATPHDGRYTAFGTMYGSNHAYYGQMDLIGDPAASTRERGLVDALVDGTYTASPRLAVRGELHRFSLASGGGSDLGWEADLLVPVRLLPTATLDVGYSVFRAGRNAAAISAGSRGHTRDWAFVQLRAAF